MHLLALSRTDTWSNRVAVTGYASIRIILKYWQQGDRSACRLQRLAYADLSAKTEIAVRETPNSISCTDIPACSSDVPELSMRITLATQVLIINPEVS
jgi:hypothetical protein